MTAFIPTRVKKPAAAFVLICNRDQIDQKNYAAEMTAEGVTDILKLGLAF